MTFTTISTIALAAVNAAAGGQGNPLSSQQQGFADKALGFLGSGWQLGIAHHPEIRMNPYGVAHDPSSYEQVCANQNGQTASVLVNAVTGAVRHN